MNMPVQRLFVTAKSVHADLRIHGSPELIAASPWWPAAFDGMTMAYFGSERESISESSPPAVASRSTQPKQNEPATQTRYESPLPNSSHLPIVSMTLKDSGAEFAHHGTQITVLAAGLCIQGHKLKERFSWSMGKHAFCQKAKQTRRGTMAFWNISVV
jgi:hypothetical protein